MENKVRMNREVFIKALWKHRSLSVKQISKLLHVKEKTVNALVTRYKQNGWIKELKSFTGIFYFPTSKGVQLIGKQKAKKVNFSNFKHINLEIDLLNYLRQNRKKTFSNQNEFLDWYQTEKELKSEAFSKEGGKAYKYKCVDLVVDNVAYEVEPTKKDRKRYKLIFQKMSKTFKKHKWKEIVYLIHQKDKRWFIDLMNDLHPDVKLSVMIIEKLQKELTKHGTNKK